MKVDGQDEEWGGLDAANVWEKRFEPQRGPLFSAVIEETGAAAGLSLLDAGCGSGSIASAAHQAGAQVYGCDISNAMVALASARVPEGSFRVADLAALPYADSSFDIVVACDSLLSPEDALKAVRELDRVCKESGTLAILVWENPSISDYSRVIDALQGTLSTRPAITPLALSGEGILDGLLSEIGLRTTRERHVRLDYRFESFDDFWACARLLGGVKLIIDAVGEDTVRSAAHAAAKPSIQENGMLVMKNIYRLVIS